MSERRDKSELDAAVSDRTLFDAGTVDELKELIAKLAASKGGIEPLGQNDISGMVTFLENFESAAVESKFILHHVTNAVVEKSPEKLLTWAIVYMHRNSVIPSADLQREMLKLLPKRPH